MDVEFIHGRMQYIVITAIMLLPLWYYHPIRKKPRPKGIELVGTVWGLQILINLGMIGCHVLQYLSIVRIMDGGVYRYWFLIVTLVLLTLSLYKLFQHTDELFLDTYPKYRVKIVRNFILNLVVVAVLGTIILFNGINLYHTAVYLNKFI